jgi:hypothetical protein
MATKTSLDSAMMDSISLSQALKDFEVANARVLELTQRLIESERQRKELMDQLERLKLQHAGVHVPAHAPSESVLDAGLGLVRIVANKAKGILGA